MMPVSSQPAGRFKSFKPAACYQMSPAERFCSKCGQRPVFIHFPTRYVGYFARSVVRHAAIMPAAKVE